MGIAIRLESTGEKADMKILVVSHTEHYIDDKGIVYGWGATVKELDAMAERFGEVVHIACLHKTNTIPPSALPYNGKVRFVSIPPFGGAGLKNKLKIITSAISNLKVIKKELRSADVFQFRTPTSIGLYIIPYLTFFSNKKGWYKYAGNWMQGNPPLSYRVQRWMLKMQQSRKVTINGKWAYQPVNCVTFENPCLTEDDRKEGLTVLQTKDYTQSLRLCFVGRLDAEKGVYDIIDAVKNSKYNFASIDFVGDGPELNKLKQYATQKDVSVNFHGALSRAEVFIIYKQTHLILLPSKSEGFPKVIAEAANFGCLPVVSDVSSIGQYINETNGFLWDAKKSSFTDYFNSLNLADTVSLHEKATNAHQMAKSFTYNNYLDKLDKQILNG